MATTGRLSDISIFDQTFAHHHSFEILFLDEADLVLDPNHEEELDDILLRLPRLKQNLFFSATYSSRIHDLIQEISDAKDMSQVNLEEYMPANLDENGTEFSALIKELMESDDYLGDDNYLGDDDFF